MEWTSYHFSQELAGPKLLYTDLGFPWRTLYQWNFRNLAGTLFAVGGTKQTRRAIWLTFRMLKRLFPCNSSCFLITSFTDYKKLYVQQVTGDRLEQWISSFGGFDLVIGGSPCNNLTGSNRWSRDGLEGEHSSLFFDYFRILDLVKSIMGTVEHWKGTIIS